MKMSLHELSQLGNFHKVNENFYRSEQPSSEDFLKLENLGFKTILNLRNWRSDKAKAKNTHLLLERVPINTWAMTQDDVIKALQIYQSAPKPMLVHCLHGSDRTGVVIAAYRMAFENWPREKAIAEFKSDDFGYHANWFPKLLRLLESLDVEHLKSKLGLKTTGLGQ